MFAVVCTPSSGRCGISLKSVGGGAALLSCPTARHGLIPTALPHDPESDNASRASSRPITARTWTVSQSRRCWTARQLHWLPMSHVGRAGLSVPGHHLHASLSTRRHSLHKQERDHRHVSGIRAANQTWTHCTETRLLTICFPAIDLGSMYATSSMLSFGLWLEGKRDVGACPHEYCHPWTGPACSSASCQSRAEPSRFALDS
ncbi:hypothetical protein QBC41DRAFT_95547 [Cercophora samala]|uniref:Uncharacterized protein n=1 Tax=Cercophora samala TaxID=330535 RepID=A0AA39ZG35_9PEZI|nr:hypothetical protein QBC41DRAFT_95547 [Cercophora samala]